MHQPGGLREKTIEALGASETANTCWPRRSAACMASTSQRRSFAPTSLRQGQQVAAAKADAKPFDFVLRRLRFGRSEIEEALRLAW